MHSFLILLLLFANIHNMSDKNPQNLTATGLRMWACPSALYFYWRKATDQEAVSIIFVSYSSNKVIRYAFYHLPCWFHWLRLSAPRCSQLLLCHMVFGGTFTAAVHVGNVTTISYAFQFKGYSMVWLPEGPPTTARTCLLPERAVLHSRRWEILWLELGSRREGSKVEG